MLDPFRGKNPHYLAEESHDNASLPNQIRLKMGEIELRQPLDIGDHDPATRRNRLPIADHRWARYPSQGSDQDCFAETKLPRPMRADVTRIINAIEGGDSSMADELLPLVYAELRGLAASRMADERAGHTLQATALVHEAYLRLIDVPDQHWNSRNHFFMAAAEAMRRILIDRARAKASQKRGGGWQRVDLEKLNLAAEPEPDALIAVHDALERLEATDPLKASLVKLKFFAGLTNDEVAATLGISVATAKRNWRFARAWLLHEIDRDLSE